MPPTLPVNNPAFAVLITSAVAKGSIVRIDLADAKASLACSISSP